MTVLVGDCRQTLQMLEPDSVHTCVTSPPYWGLRDYGHDGQLGLEKTPDAYVANMVAVFREVRRVLKPDATLWLNLGDSYAGPKGWRPEHQRTSTLGPKRDGLSPENAAFVSKPAGFPVPEGLKAKDLVGIPWRVAFALQADGWWLRSDIIWAKPNPMPESVTDRPTKAHEYVFLLSKSASYFYDSKAIAEPLTESSISRQRYALNYTQRAYESGSTPQTGGRREPAPDDKTHRNARSVWSIASEPYDGAHFAVMPSALAARCILAGSRMGDTVLDPFLGSGTVGMVAEELGRQWVGCELNPKFVDLINERTAQRGLFGAANGQP